MKRYLSLLLATLLFLAMALPATVAAEAEFSTTPMVSAGRGHTLALRADGTVWAWGHNEHGQLGDGTIIDRHTPVQVQNLSNITAISAGERHNLALQDDGTVWMWGGFWADEDDPTPPPPKKVEGLPTIKAISAGLWHNLVLAYDGTVWAWGANNYGQLGDGTAEGREMPKVMQDISGITAISAGWGHSVALRDDGTVWAWGLNGHGQIGGGTAWMQRLPAQSQGLTGIIGISAGFLHTLALQEDGTVWAWGSGADGELGHNIAEGNHIPTQLQNIADITSVAAGSYHSVALRDDGTVWTWGGNHETPQYIDETQSSRYIPEQMRNISGAVQISAGWAHVAVLHNNGTVWTWGWNERGELGNDATTDPGIFNFPVQVLGPGGVGHFSLTEDTPFAFIFHDIPPGHWARDAVAFAHENGSMRGVAPSVFSPDTAMTRAMLATVLYRLSGEPEVTFRSVFTDVRAGQWYSDAIIWAYDNEIVFGVAEERFAPNADITREQLAVMLHRYAVAREFPTTVPDAVDITTAPDHEQISTWAEEAMRWVMYHGIITGMDSRGTLYPSGTATRAQAAVMLHRFIQSYW